ncbi:phosphoglycerate dehydrogenase-like enzyme [Leifsonia sp. AK011]|uniref:NAD(P)-dependent oxidoreductase n=1 Tax=Leifsonia sp. AK011 TaxID=2723075 RepID=UPI0015C709E1|nr:NAD(P)-dependent oxidoreductase [Leifsonia sp. AK011]NYF10061.1 phosphoglycerate dehydrogenase-like enzyme [Leifsonia sp. AK011]
MSLPSVVVAVPSEAIRERVGTLPGAEVVVWDIGDAPFDRHIDLLLARYFLPAQALAGLSPEAVSVVQSQSLGYDEVADHLPAGITFCNAVGVHEASTAELAVALTLAARRGFPAFRDAQVKGAWEHTRQPGLQRSNVVLIGVGGVGAATARRLAPFDVSVALVARTARESELGRVHGMDELPALLPEADIVIIAVPLTDDTRGLVGDDLLQHLRPGALVVNVSRGAVIDTGALVRAVSDRGILAALDVTDPEPLPSDHPLWSLPGVLITPHVGGDTGAMDHHVDVLLRAQVERLAQGLPPLHVVIPRD